VLEQLLLRENAQMPVFAIDFMLEPVINYFSPLNRKSSKITVLRAGSSVKPGFHGHRSKVDDGWMVG
jgi:hypothetical protein